MQFNATHPYEIPLKVYILFNAVIFSNWWWSMWNERKEMCEYIILLMKENDEWWIERMRSVNERSLCYICLLWSVVWNAICDILSPNRERRRLWWSGNLYYYICLLRNVCENNEKRGEKSLNDVMSPISNLSMRERNVLSLLFNGVCVCDDNYFSDNAYEREMYILTVYSTMRKLW